MTRPIVWALGTFASVGLAVMGAGERLASLGLSGDRPPREQGFVARNAATLPAASFEAGSRTETIAGDRRGHFAVEGRVEGTPVPLMVDTGASLVVLREEDAERIGIHLRRSDFTGRSRTANGTGTYAPVTLRRLSVGGIEIRDVEAAIVPRGRLGVNLLGMSFLRRLRSFDISGNRLTLQG
ncbi:TIGR02281 family clan AA aspartic protease [Enterovirga sp.]|uniref:retropepsin-like aspartic protease family protein n=1 Tax=Enterovirga sp. TaxID=2026350 RepID=UPI002B97F5F9|nr:TIGR02281 family clan AA aspartic protease [Enterovirga sp.]HMO29215.1 TIGR02281 family clan AA aspartic protease [Enterovirga sp.]